MAMSARKSFLSHNIIAPVMFFEGLQTNRDCFVTLNSNYFTTLKLCASTFQAPIKDYNTRKVHSEH